MKLRLHCRELSSTPDLVEVVAAARDQGNEVMLIERPMPDAVSVAAIGRALEVVSSAGGARLEDRQGRCLLAVADADRIRAAAKVWDSLTAEVEVDGDEGLPAVGLVGVGGFAFDPAAEPGTPWDGFPALLIRVPELSVVRVGDRTFACSARSGQSLQAMLDRFALEGEVERRSPHRALPPRHLDLTPVQEPEHWKRSVAAATGLLKSGAADKVVLAREVLARGDGAVSAGSVLRSLRASYPSCFTYLVAGGDGSALAGASPELLVRRRGRRVTSQPMAGSAPRGVDACEDQALAEVLRSNPKDAGEHEAVAAHVEQTLRQVASNLTRSRPEVLKFANIQHLATTLAGDLDAVPSPSALALAGLLHPTPAVAGHPRSQARELIRRLEGIERGWYAGGVGWVDGNGDGEFAVALRCGLLWEDGARLYAGVGVMPDSDPEAEFAETELKLRALLGALAT